jgi:peptidoglycan biosynthesis protein MviN/MurJ (putative lipid II flippase)
MLNPILRRGGVSEKIARNLLMLTIFVMLAKLVAMLKEMAIARRYGVGEVVDGYLFVFNLVSWPVSVWLSVLAVVLVPLASRLQQGDSAGVIEFRTELFGFTLLAGLALSLAAWLGLPVLLRSDWLGLSLGVRFVALETVPILALVPLLGLLIGLYSIWMLSREQHANTLYEGLPALGILLAVVLLPFDGVTPLLWGTLAGMAFQLAAVVAPPYRAGEFEMPRFRQTSPHWPAYWQGFGIMMIGQVIMSLTSVIDQFFVAGLGSGAISTLGYANRVMALFLGLGATVVSRAMLPVFSRLHVAAGDTGTRWIALRWSLWMVLLGGLALAFGWILSPWLLALLFERGAFTPTDTMVVVAVFRHGLWQLPAYFPGIVLVTLLSGRGRYAALAGVAGLSLLIKLGGNAALIPSQGLLGVQWATALMYATSTLALLVMALRVTKSASRGVNDADT